jgi:hypothetical protein
MASHAYVVFSFVCWLDLSLLWKEVDFVEVENFEIPVDLRMLMALALLIKAVMLLNFLKIKGQGRGRRMLRWQDGMRG